MVVLAAGCGGGSSSGSASPVTQGEIARPDNAPLISGTPSTTAVVGRAYSFQPSATDADGDSLTFAIENKPAWATFDSSSGLLSGTPSTADVGTTAAIKISVSNAKAESELPPFQIQIAAAAAAPPADAPPTITGQPGTTAQVGSRYVFQPSAGDSNGDTLTFSISGKPSWAAFNTASGQLTGTPAAADVGTNSNIVITVSDGQKSASLAAFSIRVAAATAQTSTNHAPTISGTAPTQIQTGQSYSFTPKAADADGDKLTFSVQNKPAWASFNSSTGALTGVPSSTGTYANVVISVSDGKASTPLPGFTIAVNAASGSGTARLDWAPPTNNTDGTPITSLAGYVVQYGNSPTLLSQEVTIANPATTTYTLTNLGSGTWYFAVSSYTASGTRSNLSNVASKTIP
jgi:hypothetical protein